MNPFILALMTAGIFIVVTRVNKYQDERAERKKSKDLPEYSEPQVQSPSGVQMAGLGRHREDSPYQMTPAQDQGVSETSPSDGLSITSKAS